MNPELYPASQKPSRLRGPLLFSSIAFGILIGCMLSILLCSTVVAATGVSRTIAVQASHGAVIPVTFNVDAPTGAHIIIGERLPEGARFITMSVSNAIAVNESPLLRQNGTLLIWEFITLDAAARVTYQVMLPTDGASAKFSMVYAMPIEIAGHDEAVVSMSSRDAIDAPSSSSLVSPRDESPSLLSSGIRRSAGVLCIVLGVVIALFLYFSKRTDPPVAQSPRQAQHSAVK